jgi:plastocyanin
MTWGHLLTAAAGVALLSCSGDGGSTQPPDNGGGSGATVAVVNNSFSPSTVEVPVNSAVTWQWNSGGVEHNVTFQTGPNSVTQASGSFSRTFTAAGSFPYSCTIHAAQGMTGLVNVTAGTGGGGEGGGGGGGGGGDYP